MKIPSDGNLHSTTTATRIMKQRATSIMAVPTSDPLLSAEEGGQAGAAVGGAPNTVEAQNNVENTTSRPRRRTWKQKINIVIYSVTIAAIVFALFSIWTEYSAICFIAFCIPLVTSPYVIHQRRKLNKLPKLRQVINLMRSEANRLVQQNVRFAESNTKLESELTRLKQIEFQLYQKCQESGSSLEEMRGLIQENGMYLREMKKLKDAHEVQELLTAILLSDSNQDFSLSEVEMDRLMLRLQCATVVDEERLRQVLGMMSSSSAHSAHQMIQEIEDSMAEDDEDWLVDNGWLV